MRSCKVPTKNGSACQMPPLTASAYCYAHDPDKTNERAAARRRGGRHRRTPKVTVLPHDPIKLRDVEDVRQLIELATQDTLAQENSARRSRILGYLAGLALKAIEAGELEDRIGAIEERLD